MEITGSLKTGVYGFRSEIRTSHTLDAATVAAIKEKRSTDIRAIQLYDAAMATKAATDRIEARLRTLKDDTTVNRHADPNTVVVLDAPLEEGKQGQLTGEATFCPDTRLQATVNPRSYPTRYYVGTAESSGKEIGRLHRYVDGYKAMSETVLHTDGAITWTTGHLTAKEFKAL